LRARVRGRLHGATPTSPNPICVRVRVHRVTFSALGLRRSMSVLALSKRNGLDTCGGGDVTPHQWASKHWPPHFEGVET
jgi:hypothetical protein